MFCFNKSSSSSGTLVPSLNWNAFKTQSCQTPPDATSAEHGENRLAWNKMSEVNQKSDTPKTEGKKMKPWFHITVTVYLVWHFQVTKEDLGELQMLWIMFSTCCLLRSSELSLFRAYSKLSGTGWRREMTEKLYGWLFGVWFSDFKLLWQ